ncbi:hypothetical protein [Shinella zoogloeoides]
MRSIVAIAALVALIAGAFPALAADPIYVWRPSEGINGGQILPATAFTPPVSGGGVDFRSSEYGQLPNYTTRIVALFAGDGLLIPIPSVFQIGQCQVLRDAVNHVPDAWISVSNSGGGGKYQVAIQAVAPGRLELTLMCVTNSGGDTETLYHEYLNLTIS